MHSNVSISKPITIIIIRNARAINECSFPMIVLALKLHFIRLTRHTIEYLMIKPTDSDMTETMDN